MSRIKVEAHIFAVSLDRQARKAYNLLEYVEMETDK